jgi:uncharacterized protein (DUF433 family)
MRFGMPEGGGLHYYQPSGADGPQRTFFGYFLRCRLWAAAHRERSVANTSVTIREVRFMRREQILTRDQDILGGTPVFTGTRVPVDTLIAHLKAGDPLEKFLADFPSVSREQAVAFLELAQQLIMQEAMDARPAG